MINNTNAILLSEQEAFEAMRNYLQAYWERFSEAYVSDVLSDTQPAFAGGAGTVDPATWKDWTKAVQKVVAKTE